jgi:serine/threonine-protein kinase
VNNADYLLLVVDDDRKNRDVLSRRLERQGFRTLHAESGRQALELIDKEPIDLVLLDVMMPEMDGLEVLANIRETRALHELPIIMVTARDTSGDIVSALQMGANDYVTKPVNFPMVLIRVQNLLAMKAARAAVVTSAPSAGKTGERLSDSTMHASGNRRVAQPPGLEGLSEYEILTELGRGGMGVVYKARHLRMNRIVALKVIDRAHLNDAKAVQRFYREVQAAAQLSHPNVVLAYDAGQVGDTHYFSMEYIEGVDLARLLDDCGRLSIYQACDFVRQVALGLQHAHERGLVHRDLKPSNLLISWQPTSGEHAPRGAGPRLSSASVVLPPVERQAVVKILDMGLVLRLDAETDMPENPKRPLTKEGVVLGTADYMAPEQWRAARSVDIRADLYSLGCTFYQMLAGNAPFASAAPMEKMLRHCMEEPPPLESLRAEVPEKVGAAVRRLMAKDRKDRYQTPAELADLMKWFCITYRGTR